MKIAIRFQTAIGPRTVIADTPDERTAQAIVNAHLALDGYAEICDPSSTFSVRQILERRRKNEARRSRAKAPKPKSNVVKLKVNEK